MIKIVKLSLVTAITLASTVYASSSGKDIPSIREKTEAIKAPLTKKSNVVNSLKSMFEEAKGSGNIRSMYSGYNNDNAKNTYATAIGGQLKYKLAKYKGFNAGVAFTTANDVNFATGDKDDGKRNDALASTKGSYTEATEAYINYEFQGLNLRVGRQLIDTPLADSDDIRVTPDTFEAYIATYETDGFFLMAGHLNQWQGYDAGLDDHWVKTGKDGVNFGGVTYANDFVKTSAWYYNITGSDNGNNAIYIDAIGNYTFSDVELHAGVQYLNESEVDNSGVKASIYGALAEVATLYTNMDNMILDNITEDRDAQTIVSGISYELGATTLLYAYGDFQGDANSAGVKAHIAEQNIAAKYSFSDDLSVNAIYIIDDNKDDTTSRCFNDKNLMVFVYKCFSINNPNFSNK